MAAAISTATNGSTLQPGATLPAYSVTFNLGMEAKFCYLYSLVCNKDHVRELVCLEHLHSIQKGSCGVKMRHPASPGLSLGTRLYTGATPWCYSIVSIFKIMFDDLQLYQIYNYVCL